MKFEPYKAVQRLMSWIVRVLAIAPLLKVSAWLSDNTAVQKIRGVEYRRKKELWPNARPARSEDAYFVYPRWSLYLQGRTFDLREAFASIDDVLEPKWPTWPRRSEIAGFRSKVHHVAWYWWRFACGIFTGVRR